jgi:arsenate reductase
VVVDGEAGHERAINSRLDPNRMTKKRILFLCTGNAARSQMAEGLMRAYHGDAFDVFSAGSRPAGWVHPLAIRALAEIGIDASAQHSKSADLYLNEPFDVVVTVCDSAAADCPLWPGAKRIEHWPIVDPSYGPDDPATRPERFAATRDELARRIEELVPTIQ